MYASDLIECSGYNSEATSGKRWNWIIVQFNSKLSHSPREFWSLNRPSELFPLEPLDQTFVLLHQIVTGCGIPWGRGQGSLIQLRAVLGERHSWKSSTSKHSRTWYKECLTVLKEYRNSPPKHMLHVCTDDVNIMRTINIEVCAKYLLWKPRGNREVSEQGDRVSIIQVLEIYCTANCH